MTMSKPIKVALAGAGAFGIKHLDGIRNIDGVEVVSLVGRELDKTKEVAAKYGIGHVATDLADSLALAEVDAVILCTPTQMHAAQAIACLKAGKHVMLDKPMATNARDAARLVAEAKKRAVLFMVGQNNRFTPEVQTLKQLIAKGVLGDVYHGKTAWTRRTGIPRIGSWFTQTKFAGGGSTYDIGVHALDRCLFLMGEFDAVAVSGQTYSKFGSRGLGEGSWGRSEIDPKKPFDVDDMSLALIKLRSGRTVLLETSWAAHQGQHDFNGTQLFGMEAGALFPPLQLFRRTKLGYATESVPVSTSLVDGNRMVHFIDCLLGKAEPYVKPAESLAVQKILDAIYASAKSGREVRIK